MLALNKSHSINKANFAKGVDNRMYCLQRDHFQGNQ